MPKKSHQNTNATLWDQVLTEATKHPEDQEYCDLVAELKGAIPDKTEEMHLGGFLGKVISQKMVNDWNKITLAITVIPDEPRFSVVHGTFYTRRPIIVDGRRRSGFMLLVRQCLATKMFEKNCGIILEASVLYPGRNIHYSAKEEES